MNMIEQRYRSSIRCEDPVMSLYVQNYLRFRETRPYIARMIRNETVRRFQPVDGR